MGAARRTGHLLVYSPASLKSRAIERLSLKSRLCSLIRMARGARVPSPSVIAGRHWIGYLLTCQPICQGILTAEPLLTVFDSRGACSTRLQMRCQYVHRRLHASPFWVIALSIAAPRCGLR